MPGLIAIILVPGLVALLVALKKHNNCITQGHAENKRSPPPMHLTARLGLAVCTLYVGPARQATHVSMTTISAERRLLRPKEKGTGKGRLVKARAKSPARKILNQE